MDGPNKGWENNFNSTKGKINVKVGHWACHGCGYLPGGQLKNSRRSDVVSELEVHRLRKGKGKLQTIWEKDKNRTGRQYKKTVPRHSGD